MDFRTGERPRPLSDSTLDEAKRDAGDLALGVETCDAPELSPPGSLWSSRNNGPIWGILDPERRDCESCVEDPVLPDRVDDAGVLGSCGDLGGREPRTRRCCSSIQEPVRSDSGYILPSTLLLTQSSRNSPSGTLISGSSRG